MILIAVLLIVIFLSLNGCSRTPPPTAELENAAREFLAMEEYPIKLRGISLQEQPDNIYLVVVDGEIDGKTVSRLLIGQQYNGDGKTYWQVAPASEYLLKALDIKKPE